MSETQTLILTRPARGSGGDRYEATDKGPIGICYFSQDFTRRSGPPVKAISVTITALEENQRDES